MKTLLFNPFYVHAMLPISVHATLPKVVHAKLLITLEDLFRYLNQFLESKGIDASDTLREDYYSNYKIRPTSYWTEDISKNERKKLLYAIGQDNDYLRKHNLTRKNIEKQTAINPLKSGGYLLTIFLENKKERKQLVYS